MPFLLCRNKVEDFATWKQVFDSHREAHLAAGLLLKNLWQELENPNVVFFLFEVTDLDQARAFISSPQVPDAQRQSGGTEPPRMYFLTDSIV